MDMAVLFGARAQAARLLHSASSDAIKADPDNNATPSADAANKPVNSKGELPKSAALCAESEPTPAGAGAPAPDNARGAKRPLQEPCGSTGTSTAPSKSPSVPTSQSQPPAQPQPHQQQQDQRPAKQARLAGGSPPVTPPSRPPASGSGHQMAAATAAAAAATRHVAAALPPLRMAQTVMLSSPPPGGLAAFCAQPHLLASAHGTAAMAGHCPMGPVVLSRPHASFGVQAPQLAYATANRQQIAVMTAGTAGVPQHPSQYAPHCLFGFRLPAPPPMAHMPPTASAAPTVPSSAPPPPPAATSCATAPPGNATGPTATSATSTSTAPQPPASRAPDAASMTDGTTAQGAAAGTGTGTSAGTTSADADGGGGPYVCSIEAALDAAIILIYQGLAGAMEAGEPMTNEHTNLLTAAAKSLVRRALQREAASLAKQEQQQRPMQAVGPRYVQ